MRLEDDGHCFVCGRLNGHGLGLEFDCSGGGARAEFTLGKHLQGYKDVVHGGIISTILDEAMVKAAIGTGVEAVTAEMTVRFKAPLMAGETAEVEARVEPKGGRLIGASSSIRRLGDGRVIATASAKLLRND